MIKLNTQTAESCKSALEVMANGDFTHWQGLPATCALATVLERYPPREGEGLTTLGRRDANFRVIEMARYSQSLDVFYGIEGGTEGERVYAIDVEYPEISPDVSMLLQHYGEPEAKLDFYWDVLLLERSEWVYPNRGITLFINLENQILLRLLVYPATSLEDYHELYRRDLYTREFPEDID